MGRVCEIANPERKYKLKKVGRATRKYSSLDTTHLLVCTYQPMPSSAVEIEAKVSKDPEDALFSFLSTE